MELGRPEGLRPLRVPQAGLTVTASTTRRVRAGDIEVEVEEAGAGERAFVLVHGFTGSRDDFREVVPVLAECGRTLALDLRGHGGSTNSGVESDYDLYRMADDVLAALDACEVPACDLLGHSMGGMIALRLTLAHPERVRSLVLMDTLAKPFRFMPPAMLDAARKLLDESGMDGLFQMLKNAPTPRPPSHLRWREEMGRETDHYHGSVKSSCFFRHGPVSTWNNE